MADLEIVYSYLAVVLGITLRIGIPILIIALISVYLHRLDEGWQKEAVSGNKTKTNFKA